MAILDPERIPAEIGLSMSQQYGTMCIIVKDDAIDPEIVIQMAKSAGAIAYEGEDTCLVIDFQTRFERQVGPELYSEDALRRSLGRISA